MTSYAYSHWDVFTDTPFSGNQSDFPALARALTLDEQDIQTRQLPVRVLSSGVPFLFVPLASRAAVDRIDVDRAALASFCAAAGLPELPVFVFSLERADDDATIYSRMFAPRLGIVEDPATGGACGPLGCYLVHQRAVNPTAAAAMISLQGVSMGRASRIHISVECTDGEITRVRVGGRAVLVARGAFDV